ncbi:MAG: hypothetical protein KF878_08230 [Planctomycetes bacterium]|nr:hypothetical protein [Planctomycetota bacterium]
MLALATLAGAATAWSPLAGRRGAPSALAAALAAAVLAGAGLLSRDDEPPG